MRVSNSGIMSTKGFKLSYDAVGFPLDKDVYPDGLPGDQKRSILRSIISREQKRSDLRVVKRGEGWNGFLWKIKVRIADLLWKGTLSDSKDLQRHDYLICGKYGAREQNVKGDTRDIVYHCNQMKRCPVCSERYHVGRSYERGRIAVAVMQANDVRHLRKFNLTMPDFLWDQIKGPDDMRALYKAANKMLQGLFGCPMDQYGRYKNGSVGIHIQVHWYSSKESWRKKPHLHCYVIPVRLEKGKAENVDRFFTEADLKRLRFAWAETLRRTCRKLGYEGIERIPNDVVVKHRFVDLPRNLKEKDRPGFNFRYDQRSPVQDQEEAVVGMDFNQELVIMAFNQSGYDYYAIWSFDDYAAEILKRLGLKATNSTYGWLRRFRQNAEALGVEVKKEKDDFDPDPDLTVKTKYRREYKAEYNKKKRRVERVKYIYVRRLTDPDKPEFWKKLDPWTVHGEEIWAGSKTRYIYGVVIGRSPPGK
ncbi:hypothetical protein ES703_43297 [subsurface metagenome]